MIFPIKLKISSHRSQWGASLPSTHLKNSCPLQWQLAQVAKERCISTPICISEDNILQPEVIFTTGLSWLDGLAMFQLSYLRSSTPVHLPHLSPHSFIHFMGSPLDSSFKQTSNAFDMRCGGIDGLCEMGLSFLRYPLVSLNRLYPFLRFYIEISRFFLTSHGELCWWDVVFCHSVLGLGMIGKVRIIRTRSSLWPLYPEFTLLALQIPNKQW